MRDFRDAKAMARTLRAALAAKDIKITVSQSLELVAEMFGGGDWNTLAAAIRAEEVARRNNASLSSSPRGDVAVVHQAPVRGLLLSRPLESTLQRALAYASHRNQEYATLEHLLLALTEDDDCLAIMSGCKVDLAKLKERLTDYIDNELKSLVSDGRDSSPTPAFKRVIERAAIQVRSFDPQEVTGADVLVAIFAERESHAAYFLEEEGMSRSDAVNYISDAIFRGKGGYPKSRRRDGRSPIDPASQSNLRAATTRVPVSLTPREERVLRMRFGIGAYTDHTLEEVGQQFSMTSERTRQIEAKALRKLKRPSRSPEADQNVKLSQSFSGDRTKQVVVEKTKRRRPRRDGKTAKNTRPAPPK